MRQAILKKVDEIEAKHCKNCTILQDANQNAKLGFEDKSTNKAVKKRGTISIQKKSF